MRVVKKVSYFEEVQLKIAELMINDRCQFGHRNFSCLLPISNFSIKSASYLFHVRAVVVLANSIEYLRDAF